MSSGGLGQIEIVVRELMQNPDLFHEGFRYALAYCPRDFVSENLLHAVKGIVGDKNYPLRLAFEKVRRARGFRAQETARDALQSALEDIGLPASRAMVVSVITRLSRCGTSERTDTMIHLLNQAMKRHGSRLGLELDPRVFAYL